MAADSLAPSAGRTSGARVLYMEDDGLTIFISKYSNYLCHLIVENWYKMKIHFMFHKNNPAQKSRVTLYTAGHLHTAVPHCSHSRAPIVHTAVPRENNEHGCVYLRRRAVCKLPGCVEGHPWKCYHHYNDVVMGTIASQITSLTIVYSTVYSDADKKKHQSSASLAFVRGIHRGPVNSPHKWPVTRKMFFDDVTMIVMIWAILAWYMERSIDLAKRMMRQHSNCNKWYLLSDIFWNFHAVTIYVRNHLVAGFSEEKVSPLNNLLIRCWNLILCVEEWDVIIRCDIYFS